MSRAEIIIVHSSDLHLGTDDSFSNSDRLETLPKVLSTAAEVNADVVLLAGDSFDNHRQPERLLQRAAQILRDYGKRVVILPGNHDPLTPDSVYRRGGLANVPNVRILGLNVDETVTFDDLELSVWGKAHLDYTDMSPLAAPAQRAMRWHIAAAHGHYVDEVRDPNRLIGSWLIHREELDATDADYVALGHWNQATKVGDENKHAYYSGSPDYTGTVNVVRFHYDGKIGIYPTAVNGRAK
ncbi:MAG TPA: metallophosphoesterase [Candidatus Binatia bacterium]|nr:metallophosphoesterase [Candidatus Binatia bacterium]